MAPKAKRLSVYEIYKSIQGESTHAGRVCTFIRLAGCPLRCNYCDTPYALTLNSGKYLTIEQILQEVRDLGSPLVELTGGEPMMQKATPALAKELITNGFQVLIETNGASRIGDLPKEVVKILDIKGPKSGEKNCLDWRNLHHLDQKDEIKFVLHDKEEYEWAENFCIEHKLFNRCTVLFSPVQRNWEEVGKHPVLEKGLSPQILAEWMSENNSQARLQLQQHKFIWDPQAKGV